MGSKVFMTYKRKRPFTGSDDNHLDLHTDAHSEISEPKSLANFDDLERPACEHALLNEGRDIGIQDENSLKNGGKSMVQCENCYSQNQDQCSEIPKLQSLSPILKCNSSEQKTISDHSDGKQTTFPQVIVAEGVSAKGKPLDDPSKLISENSNGKQIKFSPDVSMEEVSAEGKSSGDPVKPLFMNLDTSDDEFQASPLPDAYSPMESDSVLPQMLNRVDEGNLEATSKETSKLCNDSVANWKLATSLITYQRKPKRNTDTTASNIASETPLTRSSLITLKDGKKPSVNIGNSSTSPIPASGVETAVSKETEFPHLPAASRDIDCNVPLVPDEDHPPGPSELIPASTSKSNRDIQTVRARSRDKGKAVMVSSPALAVTSAKTNYLQLFPENGDTLHLGNGQERAQVAHQAYFYPPYPLPGYQVYSRETYHDFLALTTDHTQTFSAHKMLHNNYLNRARGVRGGNFFADSFRPPGAWSDEELDCLWIGVRRHGRGNWDAILRDRKLQISSWRKPWELAEKWQEEQSRVFPMTPASLPKYPNPFLSSTMIDEAQLSLGNLHASWGILNGPQFFHPMSIPISQPVPISGPLPAYGYYNPMGGTTSGKGQLPHWLREVAGPSTLPNSADCSRNQGQNQPSVVGQDQITRNQVQGQGQDQNQLTRTQGQVQNQQPSVDKPKLIGRVRVARQKGNLGRKRGRLTHADFIQPGEADNGFADNGYIVIESDGSSEETISDDRNGNGNGNRDGNVRA